MQREQLEHILRAAASIAETSDFVIVGSQSILGQFPSAPKELLLSADADLFSLADPSKTDLVEGCIGENSAFHETYGYYAHGVGPETAALPEGWQKRLVTLQNENTGKGRGLCLEVHDLAVSKLVAGREKDSDFVFSLIKHFFVDPTILGERLKTVPIDPDHIQFCIERLNRLLAHTSQNSKTTTH